MHAKAVHRNDHCGGPAVAKMFVAINVAIDAAKSLAWPLVPLPLPARPAVIGISLKLFHPDAVNDTQKVKISLSVNDTVVITDARRCR